MADFNYTRHVWIPRAAPAINADHLNEMEAGIEGAAVQANAALSTALAALPSTQKGAAGGVATLDSGGLIPAGQLPALTIGHLYTVASQVAMLALSANVGDVAVRTDLSPHETFMLQAAPASTLGNWVQITTAGAVTSIDGKTGSVSLTGDYVTPLSAQTFTSPQQAQARANIGAVAQADINTAVTNLLNGAPGALDTLKELADALGDDANFAATVTTALAGKVPAQSLTRFGLGTKISVGKTRGFDFYTGDYASDDLAVQAAVNTLPTGYTGGGGWIELGAGTFDFVGGVTIPSGLHNLRISGAGMATQIRWKNGNTFANTSAGVNYLFTTGDYCLLTNLQLNGRSTFACPINGLNTFTAQGTNTLGGGIQITGGRVWLHHVYITGMAEDGITNNGGIGAKFADVEVIGCGGWGLNLTNFLNVSVYASDNDMSSLWIGSCGGGITVNVGGIWINGAHVWGCQGDGIQINADAVRVIGCYSETNAQWGIHIVGRNNCVVTANDVWGNGCAATAVVRYGGIGVDGGRFNQISGNVIRDSRYYGVLLNGTCTDNIVEGNVGTDSYAVSVSADTTTTLTASGTQTATTAFIDNNAPSWMATATAAIGLTLVIAGAGVAGASATLQVVGWVSTTQVTLSSAMSTVTTNPTYSVHSLCYGVRETGVATRNVVKDNNFRHAALGIILVNQNSARNSRSAGNKGCDEESWYEAGNAGAGAIGPDVRNGLVYHVTLTSNITAVTFFTAGTGSVPRGTTLRVILTQDATGGRTVTGWPGTVKFKNGGAAPLTSLAANAEDEFTFIFDGANWQETSRSIGDSHDRYARKASDQTVTNSTTLVADADLTLPVYPGEILDVEAQFFLDSAQVADAKFSFTGPSGSTGTFSALAPAGSTASTTAASINPGAVALGSTYAPGTLGAGVTTPVIVRGIVVVGATAGNLALTFAQQTADASNTTMKTNSWLRVIRKG